MRKVDNVLTFIGRKAFHVGKEMAMNNGCDFHHAAFLKRGKSLIRIGVNQHESHARFIRVEDGTVLAHLHAEMDALIAARPGDYLVVIRWSKSGEVTMSKPCKHCQRFIAEAGISKVIYSNWDGEFLVERFR